MGPRPEKAPRRDPLASPSFLTLVLLMNSNPLVSIITPSYNSLPYIQQTVRAIQAQSHSNWELLITDDASTDDTVSFIQSAAAADPRIRLFQLPENSGAAVARNKSIQLAAGDFVAFCDADDLWHPSKLEKQLAFMDETIDFSFTAYELIDPHGKRLHQVVDGAQNGSIGYRNMLRKRATMGCSTVLLRRNAFPDLTMPIIRTGQDYALWLKLLKPGTRAHAFPEVLTQYRILPGSISRNKIKKAKRQWQIYRQVEHLRLADAFICFCFYAWRAVFRR